MTEYMHLVGAEDVRSAANTMRGAAETMSNAASNIGYTLEAHHRFMDDWLSRFEAIVGRANRVTNDGPSGLVESGDMG